MQPLPGSHFQDLRYFGVRFGRCCMLLLFRAGPRMTLLSHYSDGPESRQQEHFDALKKF